MGLRVSDLAVAHNPETSTSMLRDRPPVTVSQSVIKQIATLEPSSVLSDEVTLVQKLCLLCAHLRVSRPGSMRLWALRTRLASESSTAERTGWMWLAGLLVVTGASSSPVASSPTRSSVTNGLEVGSCSSELDCELNGKASGPALLVPASQRPSVFV